MFAVSVFRQPCPFRAEEKQLCLSIPGVESPNRKWCDDLARVPCSGAKRYCKVGLLHHNYLAARLCLAVSLQRDTNQSARGDIGAMKEPRESEKRFCGDVVSFWCGPEDESELEKAEMEKINLKSPRIAPDSRVVLRLLVGSVGLSTHLGNILVVFVCLFVLGGGVLQTTPVQDV